MPVELPSYLVPSNGGRWFLLEDVFLKGGYRVCATIAERDAIHALSKKVGMLVYVVEVDQEYRLTPQLNWVEHTVTGSIRSYVHTQPTALQTWPIAHGKGSKDFAWSMWDTKSRAGFPTEVQAVDLNNIVVTFGTPQAGRFVLVFA